MKFWDKFLKNNKSNSDIQGNKESEKITDSANGSQEQSYGEYENLKNRKYSRSARNKGSKKITPINKVIVFLLVVMVLVPILVLTYYQNQKKLPEPQSPDQVMVTKTENESVRQSKLEEEKTRESRSIAESEAASIAAESSRLLAESSREASIAQQSSIEAAAVSSSIAAAAAASAAEAAEAQSISAQSDSQASGSDSTTESSNSDAVGTYTVNAGDNLYRIAVNHGMTLSELLELNGLSENSEIGPGMVLRVNQ